MTYIHTAFIFWFSQVDADFKGVPINVSHFLDSSEHKFEFILSL